MLSPLAVVPIFLRSPDDFNVTLHTLKTLRETEPDLQTLVVDDCSPAQGLVDELSGHIDRLDMELERKPENSGFSKTVNVGLRHAREHGQDAILVNADLEFMESGWVEKFRTQLDTQGRPASVVGALLIYSNGLIQHAGIFFSMLTRSFDHRFRFAPADLPEARQAHCCPVTGALQYIRHECLVSVGIYDEDFSMAYEDVDYCLRVFESGRECIYQPAVTAIHHESLFRGRADDKINEWQNASWQHLMNKHRATNMARYIGEIV